MSSQSLTAKYRPRRFAEVAGQDAVKRILSRAAAEDEIAPAYLFSGTRGVGKTTLARILAKAVNCEKAPTPEPCDVCQHCRQIAAGISPDVVEIDAATHGKVDDARKLKEEVGYAPLQSRYKVYIIDEAHMLSTAAFNALLKTLEEPPPRVTFILATTEPHKFPATIVSRCQHYLFKRLTAPELETHLVSLLDREGLAHEPGAVSLLARRGAGSVRDSMSLLAQVLALGGPGLTEADTRGVLGLAGQDVFFDLLAAMRREDCPAVVEIIREILDKGLDIGFFLRELAQVWRNLFLLRQSGERGLAVVDLPSEEAASWLERAGEFDLAHIHASWQMTLDAQRRIMTSLEPALALELLLLNLACLPRLLSLGELDVAARGGPSGAPRTSGPHGPPGRAGHPPSGPSRQYPPSGVRGQPGAYGAGGGHAPSGQAGPPPGRMSPAPESGALRPSGHQTPARHEPGYGPESGPGAGQGAGPGAGREPDPEDFRAEAGSEDGGNGPAMAAPRPRTTPGLGRPEGQGPPAPPSTPARTAQPRPDGPQTFEGFRRFHESQPPESRVAGLARIKSGRYEPDQGGGLLTLVCANAFHQGQLREPDTWRRLSGLAATYFGPGVRVEVGAVNAAPRLSQEELRAYVNERPEVLLARERLGATVIDIKQRDPAPGGDA